MTDDEFKPLDLNAFLKNSQLLEPTLKEKYVDYLKQLLQKGFDAWDADPKLAYSYFLEFKQNMPDSVFPDIFLLIEKPIEDRKIQDYLEIERKTVIKSEINCICTLKACFYYTQLDIDECAEECRKILIQDNDNKYANNLLGLCLGLRMKHKEAIPYFKKVITSPDYHDSAKANLAYCYLFLRKTFRALYLNRQIVDKLADNYRVQYYMALCYARLCMFKKALYYLDRAEALEKNFSGVYLTRGDIHYKLRNFDKAFKDINRARELGSNKADALLKRI